MRDDLPGKWGLLSTTTGEMSWDLYRPKWGVDGIFHGDSNVALGRIKETESHTESNLAGGVTNLESHRVPTTANNDCSRIHSSL